MRFRFGNLNQNDTALAEMSVRVVGCTHIEE
jgi:hypothetical protein